MNSTQEEQRLREARGHQIPWRKWGPYLSERQWGTVREDYSQNGDAWNYFSHDQARSRAYHWGEDGIAGISDDHQYICFALALWNGEDSILKERLFGLTNSEGNHGEDVKELYFYLDNTPTHSYMKYLYKYPQSAFPYDELLQTNRQRGRHDFEYELIDTGIFNDYRYYDVFVEYAKQNPEDILVQISVYNRGPDNAELHLLPTIWFRNTWWQSEKALRPKLQAVYSSKNLTAISIHHPDLGEYTLYARGAVPLLFTDNETNQQRIFGVPNASKYVKDGINDFVVQNNEGSVNPEHIGTKASALYLLKLQPGESKVVQLRLTDVDSSHLEQAYPRGNPFGKAYTDVMAKRRLEADDFYHSITPSKTTPDSANVMRQALAGMLWTKQFYYYDVGRWLQEHGADQLSNSRSSIRNSQWTHLLSSEIISMPDKWEYPWFAAWDLAFHAIALSMVDLAYAKDQLSLILREFYLHPTGQLPAYEWNFSDVNPPVHPWAVWHVYNIEKLQRGKGDVQFLEQAFQKLMLNFTWWINRKDRTSSNVFDGGFLGLDNIGVFDRSAPLPTGGYLEEADGTAWMALFSQNMLEIALELALHDPIYEDLALKFGEHFLWIASAMDRTGNQRDSMWDGEDGFFYDLMRLPDGSTTRLKVRSIVGLLTLCASTVIPTTFADRFPKLIERAQEFLSRQSRQIATIAPPDKPGVAGRLLLAILNEEKLRRVLRYMLDENEFLSPYGIRSLSKFHAQHPYEYFVNGQLLQVSYLPAESDSGMFGGNSNWRGPVWMPINVLLIRGLLNLYTYYGNDFTVECPTGSGIKMNLLEVSAEIGKRLICLFTRNEHGCRPIFGGIEKFQVDPDWQDLLLFHEYFHGDNGAGIGASHQTGWTGLVAHLIQLFGYARSEDILENGFEASGIYRVDEATSL